MIFGLETADTNEAKGALRLLPQVHRAASPGAAQQRILTKKETPNRPVFHAFFLANDHLMLGYSYSFNNSAFHMGILRLRFPADAPSRSSLKLEEAFYVFVPKEEWDLRPVLRPEGRGSWRLPGWLDLSAGASRHDGDGGGQRHDGPIP